MKKTTKNKKDKQPKQETKQKESFRDVLKRLFSHKLDKPASNKEGEIWMKINNND